MNYGEEALIAHKKWNGKLETISKSPVKDRDALSITPSSRPPGR